MNKRSFLAAVSLYMLILCVGTAGSASAHFGMVIPSDQMVMGDEEKEITIELKFWHPFEGQGMELVKPARFGVVANGKKIDLLGTLQPTRAEGCQTWMTRYRIMRPGVYVFYMEPQPYWEPVEGCYIIHYTKTVVTAFGDDEGWDREIGLKTEIVPLSKPYGLYAGNVFQGIVKLDGRPVPYARVEVEYYNMDGRHKAPATYMVTQTIKSDQNGVFTYAAPKAGWWGFAALNSADARIKYNGEDKEVELGAVLWVKFHNME